MRNKITTIILLMIAGLLACTSNTPTTIHLKGSFKDFGTNTITMSYNGASSILGDKHDITLYADLNGNIDTTIIIDKPSYFNISRNTIYLTPGDDLTFTISPNSDEAVFSGKGSEVNTYMKKRLFPKGGSFIKSGKNIKSSFELTKAFIDSLAVERIKELNALSQASDEFKELETARVYADIINSYFSYVRYSKKYKGTEAEGKRKEFYNSISGEVEKLLAKINKDKFLDITVVRDVMSYAYYNQTKEIFKNTPPTIRRQELFLAKETAGILRIEVSQHLVDSVTSILNGLSQKDFTEMALAEVEKASSLLPSHPAIDFELQTIDGDIKKLSDFKGKVLYVDFWATWCGPCIQESPKFHELSQKYKDIEFIQISTDRNPKIWKNYLKSKDYPITQYNSSDSRLRQGWNILYIPRFVLIDKDFKIINAFAPKPSEPTIEVILNNLI